MLGRAARSRWRLSHNTPNPNGRPSRKKNQTGGHERAGQLGRPGLGAHALAGGASQRRGGVETTVWLATLPDGGPSGQFFRDKQPIPW